MKRRLWILSCAFLVAGSSVPVWAVKVPGIKEVPPAPTRWAANGPGGTPGYIRNVQPLLGKMGCSNRACHGSFQGQGGFRLSLFGSDPKLDVDNLLKDPKGAR